MLKLIATATMLGFVFVLLKQFNASQGIMALTLAGAFLSALIANLLQDA